MEEEQWTLHSKARWIDLDGGLEGHCRAKAKMNVFPMNEGHLHSDCMRHCEKLRGRCPSVKTKRDWENISKEIKTVSPDPSQLPERIWLIATKGDIEGKLGKLDHWPEGIEAEEGVWRDYYTGEQLENYTKPRSDSNGDKDAGEEYNCILFFPKSEESRIWREWQCDGSCLALGCPCSYDSPPSSN